MVRYSFLVQLSHPLLHAGLSRRIPALPIEPFFLKQTTRKHHYTITESATELGIIASGDDAFLLRLLAWRSILCSHCVACPLCNVADCCSNRPVSLCQPTPIFVHSNNGVGQCSLRFR